MAALPTTQEQTKMDSSHRSVCVIGQNFQGAFGIGNENIQTHDQLIKCHWSENIQVRNIYTADQYTLVEDTDDNYYSAGYNANGACTVKDQSSYILSMTPITCLKEHN
eukprot:488581_1